MWSRWFGPGETKVIFLGLDNAGKTTIVYKLAVGEAVATTPTVGSNVEEFTDHGIHYVAWDIGGQETLRDAWSTYFSGARVLVFVVDSTDRGRIAVARDALHSILADDMLASACVLVLANKQDVKGAMTAADISCEFALHELRSHEWHIEPCCALTGQGLKEGFEWVAQTIPKK